MPNKKLLIITYYWPPAGGPGVQRWLKFANYLPDFGFDPIILTVNANQASYAIQDESLLENVDPAIRVVRTPTRELYSFYLKITKRENIPFSGFVKESKPTFKEKVIRFLRTHFFIPDPRKGWNNYAIKEAKKLIVEERINYLITTSPPHSTQLIGLKLKKRFPTLNWMADFRDPWTHIFFFNELNHSFYSRIRHNILENKVLKNADKVAVVSTSMKRDFIQDHVMQEQADKFVLLPNGYDEADFLSNPPEPDTDFTITYTGTLAPNYRIDSLVDSLIKLTKQDNKKIKIRFVGEICEKYRNILHEKLDSSLLEIIPPVKHEMSIEYLYRSHILLLVIPDSPGNEAILTGKLFEYLAVYKPILGIGPIQGDASEILQESDAGSMFSYSDQEGIENYISQLYTTDLTANLLSNSAVIAKYSRKNLASSIPQLFNT